MTGEHRKFGENEALMTQQTEHRMEQRNQGQHIGCFLRLSAWISFQEEVPMRELYKNVEET